MIQLNWPLMYLGIELSQNRNAHVSIIEIAFGFSSIFGSPCFFYKVFDANQFLIVSYISSVCYEKLILFSNLCGSYVVILVTESCVEFRS